MEPDNPLDGVTDEQLLAVFKEVETPAPPPHFVARTMQAVMRAPLAPGRKPLRDPLAAVLGWAALIAAVAFAAGLIANTQPIVAASFSRLITHGVGTGVWFMQFAETGFRLFDVLRIASVAVSRAAGTAEGTTALVLTALVGALSLSTLHRVLISEGEDSPWQELS